MSRHRPGDDDPLTSPQLDLDYIDAAFSSHDVANDPASWSRLPESRRRRDLEWAGQIVDHCDIIARYVASGRPAFDDPVNPLSRDAVEMRFIKIRYAAKSLSRAFRTDCHIDGLDALIGMTDRLAHDSLRVDDELVWNAAADRLPGIRDAFARVVEHGGPWSGELMDRPSGSPEGSE